MSIERYNDGIPKENHFIWLRYLAAFSIVFSHSRQFDTAPQRYSEIVGTLTWLYPGVPVLFFISGFVINLSYTHKSSYIEYMIKRILRVYPPLWAAFLVSIFLLFATGILVASELDWLKFGLWSAGQLTLVFFYHPDFLADIGTGVLNGSLWVMPVILQFYLVLPFIKKLDQKWLADGKPYLMYGVLVTAALFNASFHYVHNFHVSNVTKVVHYLTLLPWLFFFLLGYLLSRDFHRVKQQSNRAWLSWLLLHCVLFYCLRELGFKWGRNDINPLLFSVLAMFIINISYLPSIKYPKLYQIEQFLIRNDVSFGIFVYHMVVLNLLFHFEVFVASWPLRLATLILGTIFLSAISLLVLEKPIRAQRARLISIFTNSTRTGAKEHVVETE